MTGNSSRKFSFHNVLYDTLSNRPCGFVKQPCSQKRAGRKCSDSDSGEVYDGAALDRNRLSSPHSRQIVCNRTWGDFAEGQSDARPAAHLPGRFLLGSRHRLAPNRVRLGAADVPAPPRPAISTASIGEVFVEILMDGFL